MLGHLTTPLAWEQACQQGIYRAESLELDGFIHLSRDAQLLLAANTHYRGRTDLVVLVIDQARLEPGALIDEAGSPPHSELIFPHLYSPLSLDAVRAVVPFPCESDGTFRWPEVLDAPCGERPAGC